MHLGREIAIRTSEGKIEILKTLKARVCSKFEFKVWQAQPIRGHSLTTWTRRGGKGISRNSNLDHMIKGRFHVKCTLLFTQGGEGVKIR